MDTRSCAKRSNVQTLPASRQLQLRPVQHSLRDHRSTSAMPLNAKRLLPSANVERAVSRFFILYGYDMIIFIDELNSQLQLSKCHSCCSSCQWLLSTGGFYAGSLSNGRSNFHCSTWQLWTNYLPIMCFRVHEPELCTRGILLGRTGKAQSTIFLRIEWYWTMTSGQYRKPRESSLLWRRSKHCGCLWGWQWSLAYSVG